MQRRLLIAFLVCVVLGVGFVVGTYVYVKSEIPTIRSLADYTPPQTTTVYSDDGEVIGRFFHERRTVVPLDAIPKHVIHAFLAAEDDNFYAHKGLDYAGIMRAMLKNLRPGAHRQGASTITQQTVKTLILGTERSYVRKLREAFMARELEQVLNKDEILHLYLNQIYFGSGAYGVEEAAQTYFGKSVRKLSIAEGAVLACAPKNPGRYNLRANPAATKDRFRYVINMMVDNKWITRQQADEALQAPLPQLAETPKYLGEAPHYVEFVRQHLVEQYGEEQTYEGGLKVYVGANARMQAAAHRAVRAGLEALSQQQGWAGAAHRVEVDQYEHASTVLHEAFNKALATNAEASNLPNQSAQAVWDLREVDESNLDDDDALAAHVRVKSIADNVRVVGLVTDVDPHTNNAWIDLGGPLGRITLASMEWARPFSPGTWTNPPRKPDDVVHKGDLVEVELRDLNKQAEEHDDKGRRVVTVTLVPIVKAEAALVAIDPHTHFVRAIVGGYSMEPTGFNRALQALRQPGSAFKPIVYASGLLNRVITPASPCSDSPVVMVDPGTAEKWKPDNFEDGQYDGTITYRTALKRSKNTCSVKLLDKLGPEKAIETARALGIISPLPKDLTLALGSGDVHPIELANAYTTLAAGGMFAEPVFIRKVLTRDGTVLEEHKAEPKRVLDAAVAYIITSMMRSVVQEGTAARALALGRPVAGKTGTTNEHRNVWFSGYTPELVATTWVGFDDNTPVGRSTGSSGALPMWVQFMGEALMREPVRGFAPPQDIVTVRVDPNTGLPSDDPNTSIEEVFLPGTEPKRETEVLPDMYMTDDGMGNGPPPEAPNAGGTAQ